STLRTLALAAALAAVVTVPAMAGDLKLMPKETRGVWCLDKVATDIEKNETTIDAKIFRSAAGLTCPGNEADSITINPTEIRLGVSAVCKLTQISDRHPDRFTFNCRSTRSNSVWKAAYEIFDRADNQLYVLMLG